MRQDDAGFWQIWTAGARLRHAVQLTARSANSGWPVWSPDGTRIAFDGDRADPDPNDPEGVKMSSSCARTAPTSST